MGVWTFHSSLFQKIDGISNVENTFITEILPELQELITAIGGYLAQNSSADCASVNAGTAAPFSDCLGVISGLQASVNASLRANLWNDYGSIGKFEVLVRRSSNSMV